jgi:hypothetical protein
MGQLDPAGPAVRTASLLERREFEPPVLFVVPGAYERLEFFSGVTALKPIKELSSERSRRQILVEKRPTSVPVQRGKRPKRTGEVELASLAQRLRREVNASGGLIIGRSEICAWSQV